MKKKGIIYLFIVLMLTLSSWGCTIVNENKLDDARTIAKETFGMDKIFIVSSGTSNSPIASQKVRRYILYVLGEKDNEMMMIIVPALKKDKAYQVDYPFAFTFYECVDKLNSSEKGIICTQEDYKLFEIYDTLESFNRAFPNLKENDVDIMLFIEFKEYSIVQINDECVIYGEGFNQ
jgi:hypothetical protein